jgi:hypothetical protein
MLYCFKKSPFKAVKRRIKKWYVLSEFHGNNENSTLGRIGNILGLPSKEYLQIIRESARNLAGRLYYLKIKKGG